MAVAKPGDSSSSSSGGAGASGGGDGRAVELAVAGGDPGDDSTVFVFAATRMERGTQLQRNSSVHVLVAGRCVGARGVHSPVCRVLCARGSGETVRAACTVGEAAARRGAPLAVPLAAQRGAADDRDAFIVQAAASELVSGLSAVLSARQMLCAVASVLSAGREPTEAALREAAAATAGLSRFAHGGGGGGRDPIGVDGPAVPARQAMLREQGVLDAAAAILRSAFGGVCGMGALEPAAPMFGLAQALHALLRTAIRGNRENGQYCAQWLPMFVRDACRVGVGGGGSGGGLRSDETVIALISAGRAVLEAAVSEDTLTEIVDLLTSTHDARFISILASLCAVDGVAVESSQDAITARLFGRGGDDFVRFRVSGVAPGGARGPASLFGAAPAVAAAAPAVDGDASPRAAPPPPPGLCIPPLPPPQCVEISCRCARAWRYAFAYECRVAVCIRVCGSIRPVHACRAAARSSRVPSSRSPSSSTARRRPCGSTPRSCHGCTRSCASGATTTLSAPSCPDCRLTRAWPSLRRRLSPARCA